MPMCDKGSAREGRSSRFLFSVTGLCLLLLASCSSLRYVEIETYNPSEIVFPKKVRKILIVNNAVAQPKVRYEALRPMNSADTMGVRADSTTFDFCRRLGERMAQSPRFEDVRLYQGALRTDSFFASEQRLTDETVRRLCEEEGVDAVISLDRLLFKMKGVLRQGNYLPVESVDVEVLGTVRATIPDGKRALGTVLLSDTIPVNLEWDLAATEKIEELPLEEVLRGVSSYLADKTHLNFVPHWSSDTRWYYTASGSLWKEAAAYAATDHWEEAAAIWQRLYDRTPEGKAQARLAANLALSEELKGDLSKALEWAGRSHELCRKYLGASAEATRNQACYISVLEHRVHSDEALRKQF